MKTSTDRILTTHVGSLPRPGNLIALLHKKDQKGSYDNVKFDAIVTKSVDEVVARQVEIGIDLVMGHAIGSKKVDKSIVVQIGELQ